MSKHYKIENKVEVHRVIPIHNNTLLYVTLNNMIKVKRTNVTDNNVCFLHLTMANEI